jgi:hypothetical protein
MGVPSSSTPEAGPAGVADGDGSADADSDPGPDGSAETGHPRRGSNPRPAAHSETT